MIQRSLGKLEMMLVTILIFLSLLIAPLTHSSSNPQTSDTAISADVPSTGGSTGDTTSPSIPVLIRPINGTYTGDNSPEFVWRRSSDENSNTINYTFYLNGIATYLGISNIGNSSGNGYTARIEDNEIKLTPTAALVDGLYSWSVTASDLSNNSSSSTTWNFTIDTTPPFISLTDIDTYHNLILDSDHNELFTGLNFDIVGPRDVTFTIHSESWSTLTLQFFTESGELLTQSSWPLDNSGIAYPYTHLDPGIYTLSISSFDRGGNTTALPSFTLTITQASITITIPETPISEEVPIISLPYTPLSFNSLPATIAKIETRLPLSLIIIILLATTILILLILLWRHKYNLVLLNSQGQPISNAIVYHSIPTSQIKASLLLVTKYAPITYHLLFSDHGRLYIPRLSRYSTLTIRLGNSTYILSLSTKRNLYTIILG